MTSESAINRSKVIDAHVHPFGNPACNLAGKINVKRDAVLLRKRDPDLFQELWGSKMEDQTDLLIEDMDERNIDHSLIQPSVGEGNDGVAEAIKRHPDRLFGLFTTEHDLLGDRSVVKPTDLGKFGEEASRRFDDEGFRGVGEIVISDFTKESEPPKIANDLMPFVEILDRHKSPVQFPTAWTQFDTPLYHGFPLFIDNLAERYPDVPVIITKMGRGYDFIFEMCLAVAFKHEHIYLETSQAPARHISRAVSELGADRVIFGTDWCASWRELYLPKGIYRNGIDIVDDAGLSNDDKDWILGKTAAALYRI